MSYAAQKKKALWIAANVARSQVEVIEQQIATLWATFGKRSKLPVAAQGPVFFDILHSVLKNANWFPSPLFRNVLTNHLLALTGISRPEATGFVDGLSEAFPGSKCDDLSDIKTADRDFLLYILVSASMANEQAELAEEIGLGSEILEKLKNAAEAIDNRELPADVFSYLPDVDKTYADLLVELAETIQSRPWILYAHQLVFDLGPLPCSDSEYPDLAAGPYLLDILWEIGIDRLGLKKPVASLQASTWKWADAVDRSALRRLLSAKKYLFEMPVRGPRTSRKGSGVREAWLTEKGERLSAVYAAHRISADLEVVRSLAPDGMQLLSRLPASWQAEVISRGKCWDDDRLLEYLASPRALHPESVEPMIERLVGASSEPLPQGGQDDGRRRLATPLSRRLNATESTDLQVAICRGVRKWEIPIERESVEKLTNLALPPRVRDEAGRTLSSLPAS